MDKCLLLSIIEKEGERGGGMGQEILLDKYEILGKEVLFSNGSFQRVCYWIEGWHPELAHCGFAQLTWGWRGKETQLIRDEIHPKCIFKVG